MLEVGTRVKYIRKNSPEIRETGYYPPIGTAGTIVCVSSTGYQVKWDSGTIGNGIWWCDHESVEPITTTTYMCIKCPRDKRSCNNCEYMIALNNYHAALRELKEKSDKFAAYLKKTYAIDFYHPKQQYVTKVSIIYSSEMGYLDELCLSMPDISRASAITPHIGETFVDRKRKEEYEVKDIIRSIHNGEYIIQVQLKKREHKRYNI